MSDGAREAVVERLAGSHRAIVALFEPVEERPSTMDAVRTTLRVCSLLSTLAVVAWTTGQPYLFPSLGPSAYALAVSPSAATSQPQRVVGGHVFGVVAGLLAYHTVAPGLTVTQLPPALTIPGFRLAASALVALGLTSVSMIMTDLRHAPACATTLIVALGLLTSAFEAVVVVSAICLLVVVDWVLPSFGGVENPPT